MPDDVVYALAMVLSVAIGPLFRLGVKSPELKKWISSGIGFTLLCYVCGFHIIHVFIVIAGNVMLFIWHTPSKVKGLGAKCFMWNFGYLVIFRTVYLVGIPAPSPVTNAAVLFLVLRMVGLAYELQDSYERIEISKKKDSQDSDKETLDLKIKHSNIQVSIFDLILYAFCYIGILTGPYYKYRIYQDWLHLSNDIKINMKDPLMERISKVPIIAVSFLILSYFFNIKYVETDEFLECTFLFRLFYMVPMFTIFRTRLYLAWIMAESMSITAGLGAYPKDTKARCGSGPTDYQQLEKITTEESNNPELNTDREFETIHNIDIYGCELAPRTKHGLRSWNMTVQYWLANHVYHRVPLTLKAYRVALTMGVSAFWHGIHPGYYLSLLTVPPILMVEEIMIKAFRNDASPHGQNIFDWGCWFFKMRGFDYNCMGFLLLGFHSTLRYWSSIYFMGHVVIIIFFVIGNIGLMLKPKPSTEHNQ